MASATRPKPGFVLVTVLWALVGAAALAAAITVLARRAVDTAANQVSAVRSYWAAEACAEALRDSATTVLQSAPRNARDPQATWRSLDHVIGPLALNDTITTCTAHLESNGARFDINRATAPDIQRFLAAIAIEGPRADSLVAAILDWRDDDDLTRPLGAERSWYSSMSRRTPRNGAFGDQHELRYVRGIDALSDGQLAAIDTLAGVDGDLIDLWHAPRLVLRTLPGFSPAVTDVLVALRQESAGAMSLTDLLPQLKSPARDSVESHYAELISRVETQPAHYKLVACASSGAPRVTTCLQLLVGHADARLGILRRRYWVE